MKIWKMDKSVNEFAGFFLKNDHDKNIMDEVLDKGKYVEGWSVLDLKACDKEKAFADCLHLWSGGNPLVVSERAKEIIEKKFKDYVQFLPVENKENNTVYYVLNVLNIIDCIDYEKSDLKMLMNKYIIDVNRYYFNDDAQKLPIYKIYLDGVIKRIDCFVNDEFKKIIEDSGLKGFKFTEVFDFNS